MTTKAKPDAGELLKEERERGAEIDRLGAELRELEAPAPALTWEEIQAGAIGDLEERERRKGIVSRLIVAAKVKRLEIVRERYEAELGLLFEARKRAQARLEEATAKRLAAVEEEGAARGEDSSANMRIRHTKQRAEQVERDLRALRGEA